MDIALTASEDEVLIGGVKNVASDRHVPGTMKTDAGVWVGEW